MENKLVSIVIATFNAEKYILDLLDSVKKQTYENLELIIADDCSADNTQNIIADWVTENRGRFFPGGTFICKGKSRHMQKLQSGNEKKQWRVY